MLSPRLSAVQAPANDAPPKKSIQDLGRLPSFPDEARGLAAETLCRQAGTMPATFCARLCARCAGAKLAMPRRHCHLWPLNEGEKDGSRRPL